KKREMQLKFDKTIVRQGNYVPRTRTNVTQPELIQTMSFHVPSIILLLDHDAPIPEDPTLSPVLHWVAIIDDRGQVYSIVPYAPMTPPPHSNHHHYQVILYTSSSPYTEEQIINDGYLAQIRNKQQKRTNFPWEAFVQHYALIPDQVLDFFSK